jgi:hypothetical protein
LLIGHFDGYLYATLPASFLDVEDAHQPGLVVLDRFRAIEEGDTE